jgi:hypothetical protein
VYIENVHPTLRAAMDGPEGRSDVVTGADLDGYQVTQVMDSELKSLLKLITIPPAHNCVWLSDRCTGVRCGEA